MLATIRMLMSTEFLYEQELDIILLQEATTLVLTR